MNKINTWEFKWPYVDFDEKEILNIFSYHPPTEEQRVVYEEINAAFIKLALDVVQKLPAGPGRTNAVRKIKDAQMACNAAIALDGTF